MDSRLLSEVNEFFAHKLMTKNLNDTLNLELNEERHQLLARRQEMDFAKHEYTNNASEAKKRAYEAALSRFTQQSEKVMTSVLSHKN